MPGLLAALPIRLTDRLHTQDSRRRPCTPHAAGREEEIRPTASSVSHKTPHTLLPGRSHFALTRQTHLSFLPLVPGATLSPFLSPVSTPPHRGPGTGPPCAPCGETEAQGVEEAESRSGSESPAASCLPWPAGQGWAWEAVCRAGEPCSLGAGAPRASRRGGCGQRVTGKRRLSQNALKRKREG